MMRSRELQEAASHLPGVKWHGDYISACCPFHRDSSPSLLVNKHRFRCLSPQCRKEGTLDYLLRVLRGETDVRTYRNKPVRSVGASLRPALPHASDLVELERLAMEAHVRLLRFSEFQHYLRLRGIEGRIVPQRLGWYEGWYTMPFFDADYQVIGLALRASTAIAAAGGERFAMPYGSRPMLYCPDWKKFLEADRVLIAFGYFDTLTLADLGFPVATVQPGDLSPHGRLLEPLRKPLYLLPDLRAVGRANELLGDLDWRGRIIVLPYNDLVQDVNDHLVKPGGMGGPTLKRTLLREMKK